MVLLLFLLPIGILATSTASILIKLCDAPALIIAAYRMGFASLMLIPWATHRRVWNEWDGAQLRWCSLSGLFLGLHFAFWIGSLKFTSVASSVVLVSTNPIFVGIGSWLFLRERPHLNLILGIIFSVLGTVLISFGDMAISSETLIGDGLALVGAIMASAYFLVGRKMRKAQNLLAYILPVYATAGLVLILLSVMSQKSFHGYSSSTYFILFLLALIPQLIGHTTYNWALKYLPASMVAIATLGEPVGSTILAYFILGEQLTSLKVAGGISIFIGILIAVKKETAHK